MDETITLQTIANDERVNVDYQDDDIVIIYNVRNLTTPPSARMNMNMLVICTNGHGQGQLDGRDITVSKNQVYVFPPNVTLSNFMISTDFEFKAIFFTTRILQSFLREKMSIWNEVMYIRHLHQLDLNESEVDFYTHFYEMLRMCIDPSTEVPFRREIILGLLRVGFLGLSGWMTQQTGQATLPPAEPRQQRSTLFQRFLDLLGTSPVKHRTVESYASELCITAKHLSAVCKRHSGKTANEWITERVMQDIRFQLCHTDNSIKQVCAVLGFPNPSFFGKYVRDHFGMTPVQLRHS